MTAAIYYHPEAYTTSGPKLMGRNAAGESFLRGFLAHSKTNEFWTQVENTEYARILWRFIKWVRNRSSACCLTLLIVSLEFRYS